ncbi:hypothetical protein PC9H_002551 [Pleurotus ostreatus]|uniref:Uncharacterized protein n=1 Tax=Pleurotus ostreatus TaxID=5322 RepID=A0A8H6ZK47_PLEOS|nr:uncharacterized protein PC9H_002551 [Pleurotus ostreatus]KAF7416286.1 hypothetical protein PC9H_002551 [Pleurotus ostreatus]
MLPPPHFDMTTVPNALPASLLQTKSSSNQQGTSDHDQAAHIHFIPHSQKSIRLNTMQLSNMLLSPPRYGSLPADQHQHGHPQGRRLSSTQRGRGRERDSFIFPTHTVSEDLPPVETSVVKDDPVHASRVPQHIAFSVDGPHIDLSLSTGSLSASSHASSSVDALTASTNRFPSTLSFFDSDDSDSGRESDNDTEVGGYDATPRPPTSSLPLVSPAPPRSPSSNSGPSGLSLLLSRTREPDQRAQSDLDHDRGIGSHGVRESPTDLEGNASAVTLTKPSLTSPNPSPSLYTSHAYEAMHVNSPLNPRTHDERAPLLSKASNGVVPAEHSISAYTGRSPHAQSSQPQSHSHSHSHSHSPFKGQGTSGLLSPLTGVISRTVAAGWRETNNVDNWRSAVKALPAVLLGSLLNILDGVSYGMIIFPASSVFAEHQAGPMGVSMFFVSCVIAQLVYTFGGSGFAGANGSMMIEVVPFFHILATSIAEEIGEEYPREIIATTLVAYALSSILTGLAFFLLGALKLGVVIGFFPRHILVGCIGGVGVFLIQTGLTVSTRLPDDDFAFNLATFKFFFLDSHNLVLWLVPLALAMLLRLLTYKYTHQLLFPMYFITIPILFYVVVAAGQLDLGALRRDGWLFNIATEHVAWYKFYTYLDFNAVRFSPLWNTLPTQFALLFFNVLHPPLNVPALSVSLNEDIDTNKELVGHGYSNLLAGLAGTVPNYLVYVNTLLFYRVGGSTRIAGFLLAVATAALLFIGTGPIAFIPVMVVGALILVLGLDLVKEAVWDARHRASRNEYITIISIMVCMTVWDFVIGVLFGIIMSCFFFVVQNSQVPSIRAVHNGETAMSSVRRPSSQRDYLREVSKQTTIMNLQGFLFFGTIVSVEECIRDLIEGASWNRNPVRFLVLDLSMAAGIDMSAAEAFVRVHRLVMAKHVILVFCGFDSRSAIGQALETVEVLGANGVELFSTLNDALEWTENAYLRAWFRSHKTEISAYALPGRREADIQFAESLVSSPRISHLHDAGNRTIAQAQGFHHDVNVEDHLEPFNTLVKAFSSYGEISLEQFRPMLSSLQRISIPDGHVLWKQNDVADGLYIVESGVLRARYDFADFTPNLEESMVPGTLAGELTALSDSPRNATVVAERPSVLWKLSMQDLRALEKEHPALFWKFCQLVLKVAKVDYDILLSSLATRR